MQPGKWVAGHVFPVGSRPGDVFSERRKAQPSSPSASTTPPRLPSSSFLRTSVLNVCQWSRTSGLSLKLYKTRDRAPWQQLPPLTGIARVLTVQVSMTFASGSVDYVCRKITLQSTMPWALASGYGRYALGKLISKDVYIRTNQRADE